MLLLENRSLLAGQKLQQDGKMMKKIMDLVSLYEVRAPEDGGLCNLSGECV